ncbi:hypothetical protein ACFRAO_03110 [Streptomyces sp. NPDC056656]|uniref:hypothetical protein n=1 Tax=Streptomyces sp. NPDC056656 TaxID=3345895 RepID=UPI0036CFFA86
MNELTSRVERLRSTLSGTAPDDERLEGARADARLLEPLELGALLPFVHRTIADEEAPEHARGLAREVTWAQASGGTTRRTRHGAGRRSAAWAAGRVSRDGDPVDNAVPTGKNTRALPYLSYGDRLLERMVRTVEALLEAG